LTISPTGRFARGELASKDVRTAFARVSEFLRADPDMFGVNAMLGDARIFASLHDAIAASRADRALKDPEGAKTPV
jgi:hypothetical protein